MGNLERLSVVVPVYNGAKSLKALCEGIFKSASGHFESVEIILVDDGSMDESYRTMKELRNSDSRIKLIKLRKNSGQQNATFCGLQFAGGDIIATLDDDLQHPPEILGPMKAEMDKGAELVFAVPEKPAQKRYRRLGSKLTFLAFNLILGTDKPVRISSCRMFAREIKDGLEDRDSGFVYVSAELIRRTDKIAWLPLSHEERAHGESNYTLAGLVGIFAKLIIHYSDLRILRLFRRSGKLYEVESLEIEGEPGL